MAATDRSGRLPAHEVVDGLTVRRFPAYPVNLDLYLAPRLGRFVAHSGADLVHVQGFHTLVAPMAMFAALSAGLPYVVSLHTGGHSSPLRNAVRPLQARLLIPFIRRAGAVICGSRWEAGYVGQQLGLEPERIAIIPSGVDVARLSPDEAGRSDPDLVVSPGRLEHYKGHHRVVEAFPLILARRPNARLRLLGDGPAEATLREQADRAGIGDRVVIGPVHGRGAAARVMAGAAVVVSMSDYESQGIAIHEAAALGRPTVVANATALGELVDVGAARGGPSTHRQARWRMQLWRRWTRRHRRRSPQPPGTSPHQWSRNCTAACSRRAAPSRRRRVPGEAPGRPWHPACRVVDAGGERCPGRSGGGSSSGSPRRTSASSPRS